MLTYGAVFIIVLILSKKLIDIRRYAANELVYGTSGAPKKDSKVLDNCLLTLFSFLGIFGFIQMTSNIHLFALAVLLLATSLWFFHLYQQLYAVDFLIHVVNKEPKKENGQPENDNQLVALLIIMIRILKKFMKLALVVVILTLSNLITNNWYQIIGMFG